MPLHLLKEKEAYERLLKLDQQAQKEIERCQYTPELYDNLYNTVLIKKFMDYLLSMAVLFYGEAAKNTNSWLVIEFRFGRDPRFSFLKRLHKEMGDLIDSFQECCRVFEISEHLVRTMRTTSFQKVIDDTELLLPTWRDYEAQYNTYFEKLKTARNIYQILKEEFTDKFEEIKRKTAKQLKIDKMHNNQLAKTQAGVIQKPSINPPPTVTAAFSANGIYPGIFAAASTETAPATTTAKNCCSRLLTYFQNLI